ncbi:hypothetical protein QQF64_000242 [Cirrhinus molitorella]|uniref:Uncharacterized protein n=1 Tax=Cirrhinus molitorella TaxID=172907 RepID=A0ABR3NX07_9TELE
MTQPERGCHKLATTGPDLGRISQMAWTTSGPVLVDKSQPQLDQIWAASDKSHGQHLVQMWLTSGFDMAHIYPFWIDKHM